jgi:hypothetical protein
MNRSASVEVWVEMADPIHCVAHCDQAQRDGARAAVHPSVSRCLLLVVPRASETTGQDEVLIMRERPEAVARLTFHRLPCPYPRRGLKDLSRKSVSPFKQALT